LAVASATGVWAFGKAIAMRMVIVKDVVRLACQHVLTDHHLFAHDQAPRASELGNPTGLSWQWMTTPPSEADLSRGKPVGEAA
jgi:hypothetical protein